MSRCGMDGLVVIRKGRGKDYRTSGVVPAVKGTAQFDCPLTVCGTDAATQEAATIGIPWRWLGRRQFAAG